MVDGHHVVGMVAGVGYDDLVRSSETRIVLETLIEKVFSHLSFVRHFQVPEGIVFVLRDDALVAVDAIDLDLYEILKYAEEYRDTSLAIGISSGFQRFHEYPKAYREAEQALRHARYFYMGQIMYYDDIEVRERRNIEIEDSLMTTFEQAMKYGEKKDILQAIETLLQLAVPDAEEYIIDPQLLWIKMANSLINYAASIAVNISEVVEGDLIDHMARFSDMDEVKAYLYDIILRLRQSSVNVQVTRTERIIEEVYQYIETHYADPTISLETVTQALGISISYLSMLLKKHRGVTYTKELIRYRMEQAKELLKTTNLKIVSIAKQVGYHEVYYFSHSFKRHTGMSPREFRERG
jgi:two-component system response regulator YesN